METNIPKAREKDSISIIQMSNDKLAKKWIHAIGMCGLSLCAGVPVMQSMYEAYMRNGVPSNMNSAVAMERGALMMSVGLESRSASVTDLARVSVFNAWGITPDEQLAIESYFSKWQFSPEDPILTTDVTDASTAPL
jgi:hypothetical protein